MKKLPTTWDLSPFGRRYNDPTFAKERASIEKKTRAFAKTWKNDQSYLTKPTSLKKALDQYEALARIPSNEAMYLFFARMGDSTNKDYAAAEKRYDDWSEKLSDHTRFFGLSLGTIKEKDQKIFLKSSQLKPYRHFLRGIFETAQFQLSEKEEKILSMKSGVSSGNWASMVSEIFSQESAEVLVEEKGRVKKATKPFNEYIQFIHSSNKRVRDAAATALEATFKRHRLVLEKEFNSILEDKKINDELRGFKRPDHARILSDDVGFDVVDTMTGVVSKRFKVARDYYALKARLLGQEKLHYHERNVPVGNVDTEYSYEKSVELVDQALSSVDPDFAQIHRDTVENGRVDVYPRTGKRGSAFCMYDEVTKPPYIMLNHTDRARDVLTLGHEMGHAIHGTLIKGENALNYDTPMFTAEIASTFCEGYTFDRILAQATGEERFILLMQKIGEDVSTISRQVAAYNFECEVHDTFRKEGYLSADQIGAIFKKHMASYMGPAVIQDYGAEDWWMYWSHFRSPFYVYSYASGLLLANGMRAIIRKDPERWPKVKKFFYVGTSQSPKDTFDAIGIDLTDAAFWEGGVKEVEMMLKEAAKLAKELGKI